MSPDAGGAAGAKVRTTLSTLTLIALAMLSVPVGALTPMVTGGTWYETVVVVLTVLGPIVVAAVAGLAAWVRGPRAWAPPAGILVIIALWIVADGLSGWRLL